MWRRVTVAPKKTRSIPSLKRTRVREVDASIAGPYALEAFV
jgi:hypothetical protein